MKWKLPNKTCPECGIRGKMDSPEKIYLQNMTWKEVEERVKKNDLIIVPIGSTENHGPGACSGEDTFLVTRMAELVAEKTGCTVAQPIWYGSHPYHHLGMTGTIVVPEEVFKGNLRAVIAGLWNMGFRKQILLNGHGQEYVIPSAIHEWGKKYQLPAVVVNLNWYHAIPNECKDKEHGGPFETPFIHADEAETSFSLALFPEFIKMEDEVDTVPRGYLPEGHIDKAGNLYQKPVKWYGQVGCGPIEIVAYPKGCVGKATLAKAEKAYPGLNKLLDYIVKLHNDILERFPPGKLPPTEEVTRRDPNIIADVLKLPWEKGWKDIYTIAYPP